MNIETTFHINDEGTKTKTVLADLNISIGQIFQIRVFRFKIESITWTINRDGSGMIKNVYLKLEKKLEQNEKESFERALTETSWE